MGIKNIGQQRQQMDPNQVARQIESNTGAMLSQAHMNVPQAKQGSIVEHLLQTGQITQKQWEEAQRKAAAFRGRK